MRLPFVACVATAAMLLGAPTVASAESSLPPQGMYEQCPPATEMARCVTNLQRLGAAGFRLVLNYNQLNATPEDLVAYAAAARDAGVQLIWPLNQQAIRRGESVRKFFPRLAAACACDGQDLLAFIVSIARDQPATWGYYVGDEVDPAELPLVAALRDRVRALDPSRPSLYVAYENQATLGANLAPFAAAADVIGAATYPVGTVQPVSYTQTVGDLVGGLAARGGAGAAMVLQAFDWSQAPGEYPGASGYPTFEQMREQRDGALHADPAMVLWYSLHQLDRSDNPAGHWSDLVAAAFSPPPPPMPVRTSSTSTVVAAPKPVRPRRKAGRCVRWKRLSAGQRQARATKRRAVCVRRQQPRR